MVLDKLCCKYNYTQCRERRQKKI